MMGPLASSSEAKPPECAEGGRRGGGLEGDETIIRWKERAPLGVSIEAVERLIRGQDVGDRGQRDRCMSGNVVADESWGARNCYL